MVTVINERITTMNNNLSTQALVHKTKEQLLEMLSEATSYAAEENTTEALHEAIEQVQAVAYVLANCDYKDSNAAYVNNKGEVVTYDN